MSENDPIATQDGINDSIEYVESYKVKKAFYEGLCIGTLVAFIIVGVVCLIA